jgi:hypothetical protein
MLFFEFRKVAKRILIEASVMKVSVALRIPRRLQLLTSGFLVVTCVMLLPHVAAGDEPNQVSLAKAVRSSIADRSIAFDPPAFRYDEESKILYYFLGGRKTSSRVSQTPLQYPTDLQVQIELIREYRAGQINFWRPYLQNLESIVGDELKLISTFRGSDEQMLTKLGEYNEKAHSIFMDAVNTSARNRGMTAKKQYGAGGLWKVDLAPMPDGAKVYYLDKFDYSLVQKSGNLDKLTFWNQSSATSVQLANGNYYFRAKWSDGRNTTTGIIPINADKSIVLTPD